jgi:NADH:ubiquinone oxidoreductase subunit B-like Fe-S oxidoreductase
MLFVFMMNLVSYDQMEAPRATLSSGGCQLELGSHHPPLKERAQAIIKIGNQQPCGA